MQLILEDCAKRGISQYEIGGNFDDWKKKWTSTGHQIRTYYIFRRNLVALLHKAQLRTRNILKKANP